MKAVIQKLAESHGPSGFEGPVREIIRELIKPLEGTVDAMGNLLVRMGNKQKNGMRIMVAAHMDEIGVMISHIDENGFARFSPIGGVYARNCVGSRVRFTDGTIGVIGMEKQESADKLPALEKYYIDTGASNRKSCKVKVGDAASFDRPYSQTGSRLVAKAMDDRVGCAVMVEALKLIRETPTNCFLFSALRRKLVCGVRQQPPMPWRRRLAFRWMWLPRVTHRGRTTLLYGSETARRSRCATAA